MLYFQIGDGYNKKELITIEEVKTNAVLKCVYTYTPYDTFIEHCQEKNQEKNKFLKYFNF